MDEKGIRLVEDTRTALALGIAACKPGAHFKDIGGVIHEFALSRGYSVNTDFCGHGIGSQFHEAPLIHHFANSFHGVMEENMTFTIEPMLCQGRASPSVKWDDGWTAVTPDGSRTAQAEHTVLIVSGGHDENNDHNGVEILTRRTKRIE